MGKCLQSELRTSRMENEQEESIPEPIYDVAFAFRFFETVVTIKSQSYHTFWGRHDLLVYVTGF